MVDKPTTGADEYPPHNPRIAPEKPYPGHEEREHRPLKAKQIRFVDEYLFDMDATRAAERAGYRSSYAAGKALLEDWRINQLIKDRTEQRAQRCMINADRVLLELQFAAFFDPLVAATVAIQRERTSVDEDGNITIEKFIQRGIRTAEDLEHLPPEVRRCITGWKYDRYGQIILQFMDKSHALELIGKHLGLFVERHEVVHTDHASAMDAAKRRAEQARRELGTNTPKQRGGMN